MKEHTHLAGVMTAERTNELFDKMLNWIYELIKDEESLFKILHDKIGFTKVFNKDKTKATKIATVKSFT